jgi:hypothetical protein
MIHSSKRYLFVLPLLFILALSYWRYTYILNPNYHGEPVLVNYRFYIASLGANSMVNIRSIIIYWVLFLLGNMLFFRVLFSSKEKVMAIIFFYLIISFASAIFFTADRFLLPSESLFSLVPS